MQLFIYFLPGLEAVSALECLRCGPGHYLQGWLSALPGCCQNLACQRKVDQMMALQMWGGQKLALLMWGEQMSVASPMPASNRCLRY